MPRCPDGSGLGLFCLSWDLGAGLQLYSGPLDMFIYIFSKCQGG